MGKSVHRRTFDAPRDSSAQNESERARRQAWEAIPAKALQRSGISQKSAAIQMGKCNQWVSRALRGLEKLGWRDIGAIEDPEFWEEVLDLMAEYHAVVFGPRTKAEADAEIGRRVRQLLRVVRAEE